MKHRILVADDEAASRQGLAELMASWGYDVVEAADGREALDKALAMLPAVAVIDLVMPGLDGMELLKALQADAPFAAIIILTGHATVETAVSAMKQGAYDYLTKPVDIPRLKVLLQKALDNRDRVREVTALRRRLKEVWGSGKLVGNSRPMQEVYRLIELAAPTPAPVLILGPSGTGKELVAQTIHELSPRRDGPFVAVNCSAIPETLLESEIFGHEKGAFTGAVEKRIGCFELAHGGTLLLDEVAEMSPAIQAKFLRILQDGAIRRLGGKTEIKVETRVLAATNKELARALADGSLREDLYYRLNVFTVSLPPLHERLDDVPLLAQAFIEEFAARYDKRIRSLDDAALRLLCAHSWPGNVRELRNVLERAVVSCDAEVVTAAHLPPGLGGVARDADSGSLEIAPGTSLDAAEKALILSTLQSVANNKTRAAKILGISLKTLHNKLRRYGR
jgi:DNA-binding NtrC family response regulator